MSNESNVEKVFGVIWGLWRLFCLFCWLMVLIFVIDVIMFFTGIGANHLANRQSARPITPSVPATATSPG